MNEDELLVERWRRHKIARPIWGREKIAYGTDTTCRSVGSTDARYPPIYSNLPLPSILPPDYTQEFNYIYQIDSENFLKALPGQLYSSRLVPETSNHRDTQGLNHRTEDFRKERRERFVHSSPFTVNHPSSSDEAPSPSEFSHSYKSAINFPQLSFISSKKTPPSTRSRDEFSIEPFKCGIKKCNASFFNLDSLKTHVIDSHSKDALKKDKYACQFCKNTFGSKYDRNRHERIHTGERPYRCPKCDESFSRSDALRRHIDRAVNGKSDICIPTQSCSPSFHISTSLSSSP